MKVCKGLAAMALAFAACGAASAGVCWRWTSNATAAAPAWTEVTTAELAPPAFTGASAADNVLELVGDCTLASEFAVRRDMTLRSQPGVGTRSVVMVSSSAGFAVDAVLVTAGVRYRHGAAAATVSTAAVSTVAAVGLSDDRAVQTAADAEGEMALVAAAAGGNGEGDAFGRYLSGDSATAARFVNDANGDLRGRAVDGWLVWTSAATAALPTVGGQEVEPGAVFTLARTSNAIVYPSDPVLTGEAGSQEIVFSGIAVKVPRHYTASVDGSVISVVLNDNAKPTIADAEDGGKKGIEVDGATVRIHFKAQADGLLYTLQAAPTPQGEWTSLAGPQTATDFAVPIAGERCFYRIAVTD